MESVLSGSTLVASRQEDLVVVPAVVPAAFLVALAASQGALVASRVVLQRQEEVGAVQRVLVAPQQLPATSSILQPGPS